MIEKTLASGAVLKITPGSFREQMDLFKSIMRASKGLDPATELAHAVFTSDEVERAMFRCAARCTYDNQRVNEALFDDPDPDRSARARRDYMEIVKYVIEVNCEPFFKPAFSELSAQGQNPAPGSPK